jgi:hypothetical protein
MRPTRTIRSAPYQFCRMNLSVNGRDLSDSARVSPRWGAGALGRWGAGALGRWGAGALGRWGAGALAANPCGALCLDGDAVPTPDGRRGLHPRPTALSYVALLSGFRARDAVVAGPRCAELQGIDIDVNINLRSRHKTSALASW